MLENSVQFSSGRKTRLSESLLYETLARTEILYKKSVPEIRRLLLKRSIPIKGMQKGMVGTHKCRTAVKYKSQAI